MTTFSSDQILKVKELYEGQTIHSGFSGGFCMKWKVTSVDYDKGRAFLRSGGTVCYVDGIQLRKWATYREDSCPNCKLQKSIETDSTEVKFLKQNLPPSAMHSAFKFREAQFVMRRRHANTH